MWNCVLKSTKSVQRERERERCDDLSLWVVSYRRKSCEEGGDLTGWEKSKTHERWVAPLLSFYHVVEEKYRFCFVCNSIRPVECFQTTLAKMSHHREVSTIVEFMGNVRLSNNSSGKGKAILE